MTLNTYVMELNEYLDIEWELGDVIDEVDHTEFHEAEGYDKEGRKFSATISMVDKKSGVRPAILCHCKKRNEHWKNQSSIITLKLRLLNYVNE